MNILVLAQYFPPDMGGGSTRVSNAVRGLLEKGCHVTVIAAFPHYPQGKVPHSYHGKAIVSEYFHSAKVYRVWIPAIPHSSSTKRIFLHFCFIASSLFALPFIDNIDAVWGANPNLFSFFPCSFYGLVKRAKTARNVDDLWPEVFYELGIVKSKMTKKILNFIAQLSYVYPAVITPISEGYKAFIVSKYRISPEKVRVVEVGVDQNSPMPKNKNLKAEFTVMYSGVLGLGYDFNVVLDGAKILEKNSNIVFVIRGVGETSDQLKKAIRDRKSKNVLLDNRFLSKDDLSKLLGSANVFLLPMANVGFVELGLPTKIFEYQAYGKPIICISNGEAAKYIAYSKSGIIVKHNDAKGFAEAVEKLYSNKLLAEELGRNGSQFSSENTTLDKIGAKMYDALTFALESETKNSLQQTLQGIR